MLLYFFFFKFCNLVDETLRCHIQMRAAEQYFPMVTFVFQNLTKYDWRSYFFKKEKRFVPVLSFEETDLNLIWIVSSRKLILLKC